MMNNFIKVVIFSLALIGVFTAFSIWYVPPIIPEPPPTASTVAVVPDMEDFIRLGEEVYNGKGACSLCHDPAGGRAPLLDDIAATATVRLNDARYNGSAIDTEGYLRESLTEPSAYVVAGYGVAGTGDTRSPMPPVTSPETGLTAMEVEAVIAYLQRLAGVEVTARMGEAAR